MPLFYNSHRKATGCHSFQDPHQSLYSAQPEIFFVKPGGPAPDHSQSFCSVTNRPPERLHSNRHTAYRGTPTQYSMTKS